MPYIPQNLIEASAYLYKSDEDAAAGEKYGGSGFLVRVSASPADGYQTVYAVTNDHVCHQFPIVRANMADGSTQTFHLADQEWHSHPQGDDVAVARLGLWPADAVNAFHRDEVLTPTIIDQYLIGPGDDCLMVGRFVGFDGVQRNTPVVRFGNLAMMPELVRQPERGFDQESFLVEMRSLSGFSGSPVIVYLATTGSRPQSSDGMAWASLVINRAWVLGVDWGHLPAARESNSGMAGVVPGWKVLEILDLDEVRDDRDSHVQAFLAS